jgi:four helix bundle protein
MISAKRYEDLAIWQLSVELRNRIFKLTETGPAGRDVEFRDHIRKSARSAPDNIAEGFGRFKPRPFAQFLRVARASLMETRSQLQDAIASGYFSEEVTGPLFSLQLRALAGCTRLIKYLESCKGEAPAGWDPNNPFGE